MKALAVLRKMERAFLVTVFLFMVVLFSFNILIREFGGQVASDFAWIEEAVRLLNLFLVFGALGLALERGRHVAMDTMRQKMVGRPRLTLLKLIDVTGLLLSIYLMILGVRMVDFVLMTGQRSPTLDIPMGYIYLAPVMGFGLLGLRFALSLFGVIDRYKAPAVEADPS
jgi:TRAP-type C4-dicarboxylate transport system permease small subunit